MEQDQSKTTLPSAAVSALHRGSKIEAIKLVREERGVDLKEAKDLVEEFLRTQPSIQARFNANQAQFRRKALWWLAVIAGCILMYVLLAQQ